MSILLVKNKFEVHDYIPGDFFFKVLYKNARDSVIPNLLLTFEYQNRSFVSDVVSTNGIVNPRV